jgi:hypothetical protein
MAASITTGHPTSNWRDETQSWDHHPNTWGLHPVLNFEQLDVVMWFISDVLKMKWQSYRAVWTVKVNT